MEQNNGQANQQQPETQPVRRRLVSLDALRGFDMFWIVGGGTLVHAFKKVHNQGLIKGLSTQFTHVQWEGFRFYDLIFPMFVFISGVSLVFSLNKALSTNSKRQVAQKVITRSLLLFLLGIFYYGGFSKTIPNIRWLGVLQYISLAGLCSGMLYIFARRIGVIISLCAAILLGYWAIMEFVPFPDLKLDKESLQQTVKQVGSENPRDVIATASGKVKGHYAEGYNFSNYVDYRYLPGYKINGAYENQPLMGIIGALAVGMLGLLAGMWINREDISDKRKSLGLIIGGIIITATGFIWGIRFPVIKKLWSPSFALVASGYSAILLGVFYWIVEIWEKKRWCQPFIWIGMNALTIYILRNILSFSSIASRFAGGSVQTFLDQRILKGSGSVLLAIIEVALMFAIVRFMYKRKIFIRL